MSTHRIGFGHVSTSDQNPTSQEDALKRANVDKLFVDTFTGTKASRSELDRLRGQLRRGEVLVSTRPEVLGRSAEDLRVIAGELETLSFQLEVLEQDIDTSTPEGKLFSTMVAAFAEFERGIMRSRTLDGLAAARVRGRVGGRKPKTTSNHIDEAKRLYVEGKSVSDIAAPLSISWPTIYRVLETINRKVISRVNDARIPA